MCVLLVWTSRWEWKGPEDGARVGDNGPHPWGLFRAQGAGAPKVQSPLERVVSGCESSSPAAVGRGRGQCVQEAGCAGLFRPSLLAARPPLCPRPPSPLRERRGGAAGPAGGSPPPRGGRGECKLLCAPAWAPPGHSGLAGEEPRAIPGGGGPGGGERSSWTIPRDHFWKRPSGRSWGGGLLGHTWGIFPEVGSRGHPHISTRIQEGGATRWTGVTASHNLVIGDGGGVGGWTGRDEVALRPDSAPEVSKAWAPCRQYGILGVPEVLPPALQCRPSCGLAGPSRPPSHSHRIPEPLSVRPSVLQRHRGPPGVRRGSPRSRLWGSIGWQATRGRGSGASAPSPSRATQDAASKQRPRGSGPRPGPAAGQPGRRRRAGPFRSGRHSAPGLGRGN